MASLLMTIAAPMVTYWGKTPLVLRTFHLRFKRLVGLEGLGFEGFNGGVGGLGQTLNPTLVKLWET